MFPDVAACLFDLLDRDGSPATPTLVVQTDEYGVMSGPFPLAHVQVLPTGSESYIDRTDDVQIDVYTTDGLARQTAELVRAHVCGEQQATVYGFVDDVQLASPPADRESFYDRIYKTSFTVRVTTRPVDTFV